MRTRESEMSNTVRQLGADERGATSIEYSLIAGFIALGIIAAAQAIGLELIAIFNDVAAGFKG
jgi:pilus assembly protein Flp/PilA